MVLSSFYFICPAHKEEISFKQFRNIGRKVSVLFIKNILLPLAKIKRMIYFIATGCQKSNKIEDKQESCGILKKPVKIM